LKCRTRASSTARGSGGKSGMGSSGKRYVCGTRPPCAASRRKGNLRRTIQSTQSSCGPLRFPRRFTLIRRSLPAAAGAMGRTRFAAVVHERTGLRAHFAQTPNISSVWVMFS
jgi:hypothetical protein